MSIQAINQYHAAIHKIFQFSGQNHEQAIKDEFKRLLNCYAERYNLLVVSEISINVEEKLYHSDGLITSIKKTIRPDGTVKDSLKLDRGYWESKANVDLEKEIKFKINNQYPLSNTLFQDNKLAVLYQNEERCAQAELENAEALDKLLIQFFTYKNKNIVAFYEAIDKFKQDLPTILETLRDLIVQQENSNSSFKETRHHFLKICQNYISPFMQTSDVNEMLLQHILTEEIFIKIFDNYEFHNQNNIAKELTQLEKAFFEQNSKKNLLMPIQSYYSTIKAKAAEIADHHDKQIFLKAIYENFYRAYNPKAADKLGIIYTPSEIVRFQIECVDDLLEKHFGKTLAHKDIKILDPCTGTGTYICDLIDYLPPQCLEYKYLHDIYANEIGLLPYYIASLNIEYTYQQKMGKFVDFNNICWVDTLDNTGFKYQNSNQELFGLSVENTARIKHQNDKKISVIIGNPPYYANQQSENENNKSRKYFKDLKKKTGGIDGRIKETYVAESNAQKTKQYDMYKRFIRWASDRIDEEEGIISFIVNRSFIDKEQDDGFRKCVKQEFYAAYIVDLGGDIRSNTDNVFGVKVGVAILFLVRKK